MSQSPNDGAAKAAPARRTWQPPDSPAVPGRPSANAVQWKSKWDDAFAHRTGKAAPVSELHILVDADACPVKDEIYKVAWRREVPVKVVSNSHIRVPAHALIERVVVSDKFDAADDWIVEQAGRHTVVVTGDILLADRCLKRQATVIAHNGKPFTASSIGGAIATRAIMADLRSGAGISGGPAPFAKADRSRFLQALDEALVALERRLRS
jgi:uncharacterized protein YaiI (UPF0178 family)